MRITIKRLASGTTRSRHAKAWEFKPPTCWRRRAVAITWDPAQPEPGARRRIEYLPNLTCWMRKRYYRPERRRRPRTWAAPRSKISAQKLLDISFFSRRQGSRRPTIKFYDEILAAAKARWHHTALISAEQYLFCFNRFVMFAIQYSTRRWDILL